MGDVDDDFLSGDDVFLSLRELLPKGAPPLSTADIKAELTGATTFPLDDDEDDDNKPPPPLADYNREEREMEWD